MFNVAFSEFLLSKTVFLLAYIITVSLSGFFKAWVANIMGDYTAKSLGYLTLNPSAHVDPLGVLLLMIFNFGFGREIPVDPNNIHGRFRDFKLVVLYLARSISNIIVASVGLFLLIAILGKNILFIVLPMVRYGDIYFSKFCQFCPIGLSSTLVAFAYVLLTIVYLNVVFFVLYFIFDVIKLFIYLWNKDSLMEYSLGWSYILLFIIAFVFLANPLTLFVIYIIKILGTFLASIFGIL